MHARPRLTYANVVATLALVLAMSTGGAYAASLITTSQIADGAVTARKLRSDSVRASKIDDGAVTRAKLEAASVSASKLAPGAVTSSRLGSGAVTSSKLASGSVGNLQLAQDAVSSMNITNGTVVASDLHPQATTPAHARVHGVVPSENFVGSGGLTSDMVTHVATGIDCWHDLPFNPQTISVSSWIAYGGPTVVSAAIGALTEPLCPDNTWVVVYRTSADGGSAYDGSYFIQMWP